MTISEAELQAAVIQTARLLGWRVAHFRSARTARGWRTPVAADAAGFPDLVMVHIEHGLIFAELKATRGRLSPEQEAWVSDLSAVSNFTGLRMFVWTPHDWPDRITWELSGRRVRVTVP